MDDLESLKKQLEELKALRNNLSVDINQEIAEESNDIEKSLREELDIIDEQIKVFEEDIKQTAKEYEESYKRLTTIIDEYKNSIENTNLLTEEELNKMREEYDSLLLEENERSAEIGIRLEEQKRIIRQLKSKKSRIEKNIVNAEALELSYEEYKNITGTLRKTAIMNKILEEKGLTSIIEKKANERTAEEKEMLRKTKEEILTEVSEFKKEHDDYSVLDIIEALYSLDTQYVRVESPRVTTCTSKELMIISDTSKELSYRVINPNAKVNVSTIDEAPKDMENASPNEKVNINELKPAEEKVTIFKANDEYYVRRYTIDRFKLQSANLENEVRIQGSLCYKISDKDVERIKENANNKFSPYKADIKDISLENITTNGISPEDTKEELIPGTNIKRPRDRKENETDEEYESFLENYYKIVFPSNEIVPNTEEKALAVVPQIEVDPTKTENEESNSLADDNISNIIDKELEKAEKEEDLEASNVKANRKFKIELKKGKILYNVVHTVPKIIRGIIKGFRDFMFLDVDDELNDKIEPIKKVANFIEDDSYTEKEDELKAMVEEATEETEDNLKTR